MERLLDYLTPEHYFIELRINKFTEQVQGHTTLTGTLSDLAKRQSLLKLHSKNLKISSVELNSQEPNPAPNTSTKPTATQKLFFSLTPEHETLEITLPENSPKKITLDLRYSFKINHNMEGAYLSTYEHNGKEERIVVTQFESHYAREVFPCVDEPAAKATFDLKIISTDPTDTILSNMPTKSERVLTYDSVNPDSNPEAGVELDTKVSRKIVEFETTPKMSTYLLAFALGHFNKKSETNKHGVTVTTYAALNQPKSTLTFPNKIATDTLDLYDDLFGTPYPLPKLDQVAIPDFEAGAMENWGLVTYREACLLADKSTSKSDREYIATVITHELSHQWFGNLVTMKWWNNLWLNESFANMMQYVAADRLHPEWHIWQDFFTSDCYVALRRDSLPGVQAVQQEVSDPAEIATLFDGAIVYAKGAHLMFMLMRLMGEDNFFKGLKDYFKAHAYSNTTGDDLWSALQPYANFNIKDFMDSWISQSGYPMITDGAQQRFLLTGATDDSRWPLPEITDDMSGHYIINLSGPEFSKKLENFDKLSLEQKLRLLIDRELLAQTPIVSAGSLIDLLPKFKDETSEPIWEILADIIGLLKIFCLPDTEYHTPYQKFVQTLIKSNFDRLKFTPNKNEDDADAKLRAIILNFALYTEDKTTENSLAKFLELKTIASNTPSTTTPPASSAAPANATNSASRNTNTITENLDAIAALPAEIRSSILIAKLRSDEPSILKTYLDCYPVATDPGVKSDLLAAICSIRDKSSLKPVVKLLESPDIVRPQDHAYLLAYLLNNFYTRILAFDWFYSHWDYILSITSDKSMDDYIRIVAARVRTEEEADRFFEFCKDKENEPALSRSIEIAHTDILARLRWTKNNTSAVRKRLQ